MSANKTKTSPSYVEYNPAIEWRKEEGLETLIIHLPDFKKNQLRVQISKEGVLKISGERPLTADGTKKSRFLKEEKLSEGCDMNEVRAKFSDGSLHIMMPKKKVTPETPQGTKQQPASSRQSAPPQPEATDKKPKAEAATVSDDYQKAKGTTSTEHGAKSGTSTCAQPKADQLFEDGSIMQRLRRSKKCALGFGIAAVTMIAIGAFVASKYGSNSISSPSMYMDDSGLI
ncbi:22.0 kDa heat shock protein-like isoform X2 [Chenopodium quinoa]|uniref:SHSP domain-containing protein n=1 Tax=Chenopodium quinoa TaxID=63459 RepID=A0A803MWA7_CHEQI|nr:22.0 kDa heat shock protein-like isoform X2 [Chenopodium quinoa]